MDLVYKLSLTLFSICVPFVFTHGENQKALISFHKDIKPIFQANCNGCHQPAKMKGDYLMTAFAALLEGGETGKIAIVPGKPEDSY